MDSVEAAQAASLRYVTDERPGISRVKSGSGFTYRLPDGTRVTDTATIERIKRIVIPPAWTDVWICPSANGHIQATGRDAKGRKQHRYHVRWRMVRDEAKFARLAEFGRALPRIRDRVAHDLAQSGLPRPKVLALVVWFLETTFVRIGNEEYARTNKSYGLTTLTNRHVQVSGATIKLHFVGKSGKAHDIRLTDRRIASLMRRMRDLPGQDLFQYVGEDGEPHAVSSSDVNEYLREVSGGDFTAKDFRTWAGTLLAVRQLADVADDATPSATELKTLTAAAVKAVAEQLRNTPAVCRKCYIHPQVLAAWSTPTLLSRWRTELQRSREIDGLNAEESALVRFLEAA
jgi:DNA topoisomerase-1